MGEKVGQLLLSTCRNAVDDYVNYLAAVDCIRHLTDIHPEYIRKFIQEVAFEDFYSEDGDLESAEFEKRVEEFMTRLEPDSCT